MTGKSTLSLCGAGEQSQNVMLDGQVLCQSSCNFSSICLSVYMCLGVLPACVSVTTCILCDLRGQKRVLYPLGLKFQTVESCCVDSGT